MAAELTREEREILRDDPRPSVARALDALDAAEKRAEFYGQIADDRALLRGQLQELEAEIERLRAMGDAMFTAPTGKPLGMARAAWKEARGATPN